MAIFNSKLLVDQRVCGGFILHTVVIVGWVNINQLMVVGSTHKWG